MLRVLALALPFGLAAGGVPAAFAAEEADVEKARSLVERAQHEIQVGDIRQALKKLQKAERVARESSADILVLKARCLYQLGRFEAAVRQANEALAMGLPPARRAAVLNLRAISRFDQDQVEEQRWLQRQLAIPGGLSSKDREHLENLELVEQDLRQALDLAGDADHALLYSLAQVVYRQGKHQEARALLASYLQAGPAPGTHAAAESMMCLLDQRAEMSTQEGKATSKDISYPKRLRGSLPGYTEAARRAGLQGVVVLEAIIDESGHVRCAWPLAGLPLGLTEAAVESILGWEYEPGRRDGKPVKVFFTAVVEFTVG
jgi:tetratricopeptide (TPR) repeat protein